MYNKYPILAFYMTIMMVMMFDDDEDDNVLKGEMLVGGRKCC